MTPGHVSTARALIGKRWRHRARGAHHVDCVGLLAVALAANGHAVDYDEDDYSEDEAGPLAPYAPPALPNETQTARPFRDAVWASGHWYWDGNEWRFNPGTWIASMPGYQFINGYWQQEASGWRWMIRRIGFG